MKSLRPKLDIAACTLCLKGQTKIKNSAWSGSTGANPIRSGHSRCGRG